jgi:hypothetical protein
MYSRMLGQWTLEMNHVAAIVGGFDSQQKHVGQQGVIYTPVPRERQAAAVKFLNDSAFVAPSFFVNPEILRRIEPAGVIERVRTAQRSVLTNLLSNARIARLVEQEAVDAKNPYTPVEFLDDVRKGVFSELERTAPVKIGAYRRNLQRVYLELVNDRLNRPQTAPITVPGYTPPPTTEDARPFFRSELRAVNASATAALSRAADRETRMHLEDMRDQIAKILDPKIAPTTPSASPALPRGFDLDEWLWPTSCWPDYKIKGPGSPR